MAAKKKTTKKQARSKRVARKKVLPAKMLAKESAIVKRKATKKKPARKKTAVKAKAVGKKTVGGKTVSTLKKQIWNNDQTVDTTPFSMARSRARSGGQSGDLQGLSGVGRADSESVDELLEEGNAFEADVVTGVEAAGDADGREVRTHEVPEDDVPSEYLDKD